MKTVSHSFMQSNLLRAFIFIFVLPQHQASAQCGNDPQFIVLFQSPACGDVITAPVGQLTMLSVHTSDGDNNNEHITLSSGVLPAGAVMSPPLPENDNPPSSTLMWTPTAADTGSYVIPFTVTDDCGTEVHCEFTIDVVDPCAGFGSPLFVSPSPTCGSTINAVAGVPMSFTLTASDVNHPNNPITLTTTGSGIPTGAGLTPSLPLTNNPVSTVFNWTPTMADVGQHPAEFKIHDPCTNGNEYCFYTINVIDPCDGAGSPVFIHSLPVCGSTIAATVGVPISFVVSASDVNHPGNPITLTKCCGSAALASAVLSPSSPVGNPVSANFSWTPTLADLGQQDAGFKIHDPCTNGNEYCFYIIDVSLPPPCTITVDFFGNPGACDDNGTPSDSTDDFFTQNIHASFFNRPLTGDLQIVVGGDAIGTYSIPVNSIIGNQHTFNGVKLKADGTPSVVQMNFTDAPSCIDADTGPTIHPCSTPIPPCTITVDFFGSPGACDDNGTPNDSTDDFFTQNIHASFFNRPFTGDLQIVAGGDAIGTYSIPVNNIIGNQHTFNGVKLKADGTSSVVQMNFTDAPSCIDADTGPTVHPCSTPTPPCTITVDFFGSPGACDDNGTPNDSTDDFFTQNIHASFFNRPFTGDLQIVVGGDAIGTYSIPVNSIIGNQHTFNGVKLKADGTPSVVQMNFTDAPSCIDADTGPTIHPCSTPIPPCTITVDFFGSPGACDDNGTPSDSTDDFFTQNIHASFFNRPFTGDLQIVAGGDAIGTYSIPVNSIIGNQHTFNGVKLKADGTPSVVQMNFTDAPSCIDADTGPTIHPCSTPIPPCDNLIIDDNNSCTVDACDPATGVITHTPVTIPSPVIAGQNVICTNTQGIYTAVGSTGATNYIWTLPPGVTFISGQGTATIIVKFTTACQSGNICVTASNSCAVASPVCIYITAISKTPVLSAITGQANAVCVGGSFQYCIAPVTGATNYTWTAPANTQITAGQGTNCIALNILPGFTTGKVSVTAQNCKGTSAIKSLQLKNLPPTPGVISGPSSNLCQKTGVVYSIINIANTTSYLWAVPSGANIVQGQGTNTITVDFAAAFTIGNISVKGVNACGNGPARNLAVKAKPLAPSSIIGLTPVCKNQQNVAYSVTSVTGLTYAWTVPAGATVASGQGNANITVNWGVAGGNVKVIPSNACGAGPAKTKAITVNNCTRLSGEDHDEAELLVYPNPASSEITIELNAESASKELLEIINVTGQSVYSEYKELSYGKNIIPVHAVDFAPGVYIIKIHGVNKIARIIIE